MGIISNDQVELSSRYCLTTPSISLDRGVCAHFRSRKNHNSIIHACNGACSTSHSPRLSFHIYQRTLCDALCATHTVPPACTFVISSCSFSSIAMFASTPPPSLSPPCPALFDPISSYFPATSSTAERGQGEDASAQSRETIHKQKTVIGGSTTLASAFGPATSQRRRGVHSTSRSD